MTWLIAGQDKYTTLSLLSGEISQSCPTLGLPTVPSCSSSAPQASPSQKPSQSHPDGDGDVGGHRGCPGTRGASTYLGKDRLGTLVAGSKRGLSAGSGASVGGCWALIPPDPLTAL